MLSGLKSALATKKPSAAPAAGGKKWKTRGQLAEEQQQPAASSDSGPQPFEGIKKRRVDGMALYEDAAAPVSAPAAPEQPEAPAATVTAEPEETLPVREVMRRLRARGQPVTLFGESAAQRVARFRRIEALSTESVSAGQQNVFAQLMEEVLEEDSAAVPVAMDADEAKLHKLVPSDGGNGAPEDEMLSYFYSLLHEWGLQLAARSEADRRSAVGKKDKTTWKQTLVYILPLFRKLASRTLDPTVQDPLFKITGFMKQRRYVEANDAYLLLAIGNAPWPMGVTMVGIHERSAREKIGSDNVAHVLNDETQRKYVQSVKRLISFAQKTYPSQDSVWE